MATVNKSSLRAEFDALKARFESLCAAGKMSAESRALRNLSTTLRHRRLGFTEQAVGSQPRPAG